MIISQRNLQQNLSAATISYSTRQNRHFSAAGLQHHDASGLMSMGGLFSGGNTQSPMDAAMYYNTTFDNAGMFGPGGGLASSLAPGSGTAGLYDNNSEPSNALQRLISQQTQSTSSGDGGGAVDHQALAYEQMLANQQRGASSLEAEFHFQQLWDHQQRINSSNMGHGGNGGAGLVGIPGGLPTDNPENTELARLLLMRDQLERQKNGEV